MHNAPTPWGNTPRLGTLLPQPDAPCCPKAVAAFLERNGMSASAAGHAAHNIAMGKPARITLHADTDAPAATINALRLGVRLRLV